MSKLRNIIPFESQSYADKESPRIVSYYYAKTFNAMDTEYMNPDFMDTPEEYVHIALEYLQDECMLFGDFKPSRDFLLQFLSLYNYDFSAVLWEIIKIRLLSVVDENDKEDALYYMDELECALEPIAYVNISLEDLVKDYELYLIGLKS